MGRLSRACNAPASSTSPGNGVCRRSARFARVFFTAFPVANEPSTLERFERLFLRRTNFGWRRSALFHPSSQHLLESFGGARLFDQASDVAAEARGAAIFDRGPRLPERRIGQADGNLLGHTGSI